MSPRRWSTTLAALTTACALGACGGSSQTATPAAAVHSATPAVATTQASTSSPTTHASASSPTTHASTSSATTQASTLSKTTTSTVSARPTAAPSGCQNSQLHLSAGDARAGLGHFGQTIVFTNTSSKPCTMYGYPGLALVAGGQTMAVPVQHGSSYTFHDTGRQLVTLAPGATASFTFGGLTVSQPGGQPCPRASAVRVIAPNDYTPIQLDVDTAGCPSGVDVSTVVAGSAGASGA